MDGQEKGRRWWWWWGTRRGLQRDPKGPEEQPPNAWLKTHINRQRRAHRTQYLPLLGWQFRGNLSLKYTHNTKEYYLSTLHVRGGAGMEGETREGARDSSHNIKEKKRKEKKGKEKLESLKSSSHTPVCPWLTTLWSQERRGGQRRLFCSVSFHVTLKWALLPTCTATSTCISICIAVSV